MLSARSNLAVCHPMLYSYYVPKRCTFLRRLKDQATRELYSTKGKAVARLVTVGDRSFDTAGPRLWNILPMTLHLRHLYDILTKIENAFVSAILPGHHLSLQLFIAPRSAVLPEICYFWLP